MDCWILWKRAVPSIQEFIAERAEREESNGLLDFVEESGSIDSRVHCGESRKRGIEWIVGFCGRERFHRFKSSLRREQKERNRMDCWILWKRAVPSIQEFIAERA